MAKVLFPEGLAKDMSMDVERPGRCLETALGGHGFIVTVSPTSVSAKAGYSYGCLRSAAKYQPQNRRAEIWMGRGAVHGPVVFLAESELCGLASETDVTRITKVLEANRTKI